MSRPTVNDVARVAGFSLATVDRVLDALDAARLDGVAIMAPETPPVRDAIARLKAAGVVVVTLTDVHAPIRSGDTVRIHADGNLLFFATDGARVR